MTKSATQKAKDKTLIILGEPTAWPRVKKGWHGKYYDPSKKAKESFLLQCKAQWNPDGFPSKKKFKIDVTFYCSGKEKDADNLYKFIADALEGVYWINDKQIKDVRIRVYDKQDEPKTILKIYG